jgi:hypothetical protein
VTSWCDDPSAVWSMARLGARRNQTAVDHVLSVAAAPGWTGNARRGLAATRPSRRCSPSDAQFHPSSTPKRHWRFEVANPVPAGSDVSAGTYRCTNCGNQIEVGSTRHLPPCPSCGNGEYDTVSGADSRLDPYPGRS